MKLFKKIKTVLTVTVCFTALTALSGCHEEEKAQMQTDVVSFCDDFKAMDFDSMYALTNDQTKYFNDIYIPGAEESEILFQAMADNLEYEVGECEIDGSNATVNAKISNVDMNVLMGDVLNDYFDQCEASPDNIDNINIIEIINNHLSEPDLQRREADTVFNFVKEDGKWAIESNVMVYDDITGGYMTYYFQVNMAAMSNFADSETTTAAE